MNSETYCQVSYSSNDVNSKFHHLKQDTNFFKALNRNNEARLGMEGDQRR